MPKPEELIPQHGGYRKLKSFQVAQLAYDMTVRFCDRYIDRRSRTHDQMVQAARSGVQNIAEGSLASGTSKKMELKLTNVARASLEELRLDYEDFLRQRGLSQWDLRDPRRTELIKKRPATVQEVVAWVREVYDRENRHGPHGPHGPHGHPEKSIRSTGSMRSISSEAGDGPHGHPEKSIRSTGSIGSISSEAGDGPHGPHGPSGHPERSMRSTFPEIAANAALTLIAVAISLLERQITSLAAAFENEGGFTERLYRVRSAKRRRQ